MAAKKKGRFTTSARRFQPFMPNAVRHDILVPLLRQLGAAQAGCFGGIDAGIGLVRGPTRPGGNADVEHKDHF